MIKLMYPLRRKEGISAAQLGEYWLNDHAHEAWASPMGIAAGNALTADEHEFIDVRRSPIWVAEEHEIISGDVG